MRLVFLLKLLLCDIPIDLLTTTLAVEEIRTITLLLMLLVLLVLFILNQIAMLSLSGQI